MSVKEKSEILNDEREISGIYWDDEECSSFEASESISIEAYPEAGPLDFMPYFAVLRDGGVIARVPAWQVSVHYK